MKSILCSIFGVLLFLGFLVGTIILFGINVILGVIGIVLTLTIPPILIRAAISSSRGPISKLIAKIIVPIAIVVGLAAILLSFFLGSWF